MNELRVIVDSEIIKKAIDGLRLLSFLYKKNKSLSIIGGIYGSNERSTCLSMHEISVTSEPHEDICSPIIGRDSIDIFMRMSHQPIELRITKSFVHILNAYEINLTSNKSNPFPDTSKPEKSTVKKYEAKGRAIIETIIFDGNNHHECKEFLKGNFDNSFSYPHIKRSVYDETSPFLNRIINISVNEGDLIMKKGKDDFHVIGKRYVDSFINELQEAYIKKT